MTSGHAAKDGFLRDGAWTADGNDIVRVVRSTIGNGFLDQGESTLDTLSVLSGKGADSVTIGDATILSTVKGVLHIKTTSDRLVNINGTPNQTELGDDSVSITNVRTQTPFSVMNLNGGDGIDKLIRTNSLAPNLFLGLWEL